MEYEESRSGHRIVYGEYRDWALSECEDGEVKLRTRGAFGSILFPVR